MRQSVSLERPCVKFEEHEMVEGMLSHMQEPHTFLK